jgi:hypothetical protein
LRDPRRKPTSIVLHCRCDARSLAGLLRFWQAKGMHPTGIGELARWSLESFYELVVASDSVKPTETQQDAYMELEAAGFQGKAMQSMRRRVVREMQRESIAANLADIQQESPKETLEGALKHLTASLVGGTDAKALTARILDDTLAAEQEVDALQRPPSTGSEEEGRGDSTPGGEESNGGATSEEDA